MGAAALSSASFAKRPTEELIRARDLVSGILDYRARQTSLFDPPPAPAGPVLVTPPAPVSCVPEVLSPSSVSCFQECSAKWFYRKVLELPETRTAALGLGSAIHEAVAVNFEDKLETGRDLEYAAVRSVFRDSLAAQLEQVTLSADESAEDLRDCGDAMLRVYMEQAAPGIHPAAVELPVEGEIGGVMVHGIVDLLDRDGTVVDLKTASKRPAGVSAAHRLQVSTYTALTPGASGRGRIDTLTKTKTVAHHPVTFDVTPADRKLTERLYSITLDQMKSGLVVPNRSSFLCSRKHCSFWATCESDFGGEVE